MPKKRFITSVPKRDFLLPLPIRTYDKILRAAAAENKSMVLVINELLVQALNGGKAEGARK